MCGKKSNGNADDYSPEETLKSAKNYIESARKIVGRRGNDDEYKFCRYCKKRIRKLSLKTVFFRRKKCSICGHRTCNKHMLENGVCKKCDRDGAPGHEENIILMKRKIKEFEKMKNEGLIDDVEFKELKMGILRDFASK